MARRFTHLGAAFVTATFLGGCMMLPLHGAMMGMGGHGEDSQAQGGDSPAHGEASHSGPARGHGAGHEAHAAAVNPLLARCEYPLATALVTEAASGAGAREAQRYALGAPARIARSVADASGCFLTLDPDPLLLAMPGGAQPDVMLRVRIERLGAPEPSLAERARRSFGGTPAVERLERMDLSLELLCAREKRVVAAFSGAAAGALQDPPLLREPAQAAARENRERFAQAYARAQSAAVAALRSEPRPCS